MKNSFNSHITLCELLKSWKKRSPSARFFLLVITSVLCCLLDTSTAVAESVGNPGTILAQAKLAAGGDAWNSIRSIHLLSKTVVSGLTGTEEEWDDVQNGRFVVIDHIPTDSSANGFDGVSVWTQDESGTGRILGDPDAREGAFNQAYRTMRAFWFVQRTGASLSYEGAQAQNGRSFDVIDITPQGGRTFHLWIDRSTHLIDHFVEQQGEDTLVITYSDYRAVEGIEIPYVVHIGDLDPQWDQINTLVSASINTAVADRQFSLPPPPAPDYHFLNGKTSTTVPFRLIADKLYIPIHVNGHVAIWAEFDSGGGYILNPGLAKQLKLKAIGANQTGGGGESYVAAGRVDISTVEIGDLQLTHQTFDVLQISGDRSIVGYQLLQRFKVKIDFDRGTMTFSKPSQSLPSNSGITVPFHFQDNQPETLGMVDGIAGLFAIDTGADSSLLLTAPFADKYGLLDRYRPQIPYHGSAMGGAIYGVTARAKEFEFLGGDGRPVTSVVAPLTDMSMQHAGWDADSYVGGLVGVGILKKFNLTFDYTHQQITFARNHNYNARDVYNRSGLHLSVSGASWKVTLVDPGSPAQALGIAPGDLILQINGRTSKQLDRGSLYDLWRRPVGTRVKLVVESGGAARNVVLNLRDLL